MGWVAIDNGFYKELEKNNRPFTRIEAMFCLTFDMNFNQKNTINGYSKMWQWSRNKVRKFIKESNSKQGCVAHGGKNTKGHPIRLIGNGSGDHKDTLENIKGHPTVNGINGSGNHKDTRGSKRTPPTPVKSTTLGDIRTPF